MPPAVDNGPKKVIKLAVRQWDLIPAFTRTQKLAAIQTNTDSRQTIFKKLRKNNLPIESWRNKVKFSVNCP